MILPIYLLGSIIAMLWVYFDPFYDRSIFHIIFAGLLSWIFVFLMLFGGSTNE